MPFREVGLLRFKKHASNFTSISFESTYTRTSCIRHTSCFGAWALDTSQGNQKYPYISGLLLSNPYIQAGAWQPRLAILVRLASLFAQQIIDPLSVRFDLLTARIHDRQIEPRGTITDCADFI